MDTLSRHPVWIKIAILADPNRIAYIFPRKPRFSINHFDSDVNTNVLIEVGLQTCCLLVVVQCFHNNTLLISTFRFHITLVVEYSDCFMLGDFVNIVQLAVVPFLGGFPNRRGFTTLF